MTIVEARKNDPASGGAVRALHVFAALSRGGAETWLMDMVRHCDRAKLGIDVCVIGNHVGAYEEEFRSHGGRIFRCPLRGNPWRFGRSFRRLLSRERFGIVHSHLYLFSGLVLRAASQCGVPRRIAHIHPVEDVKANRKLRSLYARWMRRWIARFGTHFVAPTPAGLESFWGPDWESDPNKCVIYNGVHIERFDRSFDPIAVRRELSLPDGARIVLNVARFAPHKRHAFLVEVADRLIERNRDVHFVLIGAGDLRDETMALVSGKRLTEHFRFVAGEPDIDRFWLTADAFAFPSGNEGFGIVVAEAAAAGLPVVAQDIPGVRDAAKACHDVVLLPLETRRDEWSRVLEKALERGRLADETRRSRLKDFPFTVERSVAALERLYGMDSSREDTNP